MQGLGGIAVTHPNKPSFTANALSEFKWSAWLEPEATDEGGAVLQELPSGIDSASIPSKLCMLVRYYFLAGSRKEVTSLSDKPHIATMKRGVMRRAYSNVNILCLGNENFELFWKGGF